uniref:Uncharacterized protein n=1 Tax=Arundo donax TaxID=35708 RepID=A0A0A9HLR1_ARUDO
MRLSFQMLKQRILKSSWSFHGWLMVPVCLQMLLNSCQRWRN